MLYLLRVPFRPVSRLSSVTQLRTNTRSMGKNSLPDGWTEYSPVGKRIPGTRFIAFKVPLKKLFDSKLAQWQRFSTSDLIREVESQNEELGLVVDLTCTTRYYSPGELPQTLHYAKLFTIGHEVPNDETIYKFKCIVRQFLSENSDNDKLIGVHCTHGLNRTGYLVCRYLIDVIGMVPSEAIEKFNRSRGHCIERKNYLDDLTHGKIRNNSGFDKPRLPVNKYNEQMPNRHNAAAPTCAPPVSPPYQQGPLWTSSHFCADPVNAPTLPTHLHHHPAHDMPHPRYPFPPREDDSFRYSRGRARYRNRRNYSHYTGACIATRNPHPPHGSSPQWTGHTSPYKRYPRPDSAGNYPQ